MVVVVVVLTTTTTTTTDYYNALRSMGFEHIVSDNHGAVIASLSFAKST